MKVYAVVFDTCDDYCFGAEINCFGIYRTKESAIKRLENLRAERKRKNLCIPDEDDCCIREFVLNADCEEYLGGYIE